MDYQDLFVIAKGTKLWARIDEDSDPCLGSIVEVFFERVSDETPTSYCVEVVTKSGVLWKWFNECKVYHTFEEAATSAIRNLDYRIAALKGDRENLIAALENAGAKSESDA